MSITSLDKNRASRTIQKYVRAKQNKNLVKNWNEKLKKRSEWSLNHKSSSNKLYALPKTLIRGHSSIKTSKRITLLDKQYIIMFSPIGCTFSYGLPFVELMSYVSSNKGLRDLIDSILISNDNYTKSLGIRVYNPRSSLPDQVISYVHDRPERRELLGKINLPNRNILNRLKTDGSISNVTSESLSNIISSKPGIYFVHTCRSFICMTNPSSRICRIIMAENSKNMNIQEKKPNSILRKPSKLTLNNRKKMVSRISKYNTLLKLYPDIVKKFYLTQNKKKKLNSNLIEFQRMEYYIRNPDKLIEYIVNYHSKFGTSTNSYHKNLNTAISDYKKLIEKFPQHKGIKVMNKSLKIMTNQKYVNFQSVNELKIIQKKQRELLSRKV